MKDKIALFAGLLFSATVAQAEVDMNDPQAVTQKLVDILYLGKAKPEEFPPLVYLPESAFEEGKTREDWQKILTNCASKWMETVKEKKYTLKEAAVPDFPLSVEEVKVIIIEESLQDKEIDGVVFFTLQKTSNGWRISKYGDDVNRNGYNLFLGCQEPIDIL